MNSAHNGQEKIGIWGLGISGMSLLRFFARLGHSLLVMDKRTPTAQEQIVLDELAVSYIPESEKERFFALADRVISSPGIDITPVRARMRDYTSELDIFFAYWKKPIIAITGSLGKTSIVTLLQTVLKQYNQSIILGGNVGIPLLDIVENEFDTALLELSSFQLEHTTNFAPDIAVITNLHPNHLDRHGTLENYFEAKYQLLKRQYSHQKALIPFSLYEHVLQQPEMLTRKLHIWNPVAVTNEKLRPQDTLYYISDGHLMKYEQGKHTLLISIAKLPSVSYPQNWIIIASIMDMLGLVLEKLHNLSDIEIPAHRCQFVREHKGISYYNDSKSTVTQATEAAVDRFAGKRIHLLLGGMSKGVDRIPFIHTLTSKVTSIICFGGEAGALYQASCDAGILTYCKHTLEEAVITAHILAQSGDIVLFSPAGSSYDLFKDYIERGNTFVNLVNALSS